MKNGKFRFDPLTLIEFWEKSHQESSDDYTQAHLVMDTLPEAVKALGKEITEICYERVIVEVNDADEKKA